MNDKTSNSILTVVFPTNELDGYVPTKGLQVLMPDSTPLPRVKSVTVSAEFDNLVEVSIKAFARVSVAPVGGAVGQKYKWSDVTDLDSTHRDYISKPSD